VIGAWEALGPRPVHVVVSTLRVLALSFLLLEVFIFLFISLFIIIKDLFYSNEGLHVLQAGFHSPQF